MDPTTSDEALEALLPFILEKPTLHCDSGTALISLTKFIQWVRTSCAKHMEPNVLHLNGNLKPLAMSLLYGREVSPHMAYEIRDELISKVYSCGSVLAETKKWLTATFSTDAAMQVCVHKYCILNLTYLGLCTQVLSFSISHLLKTQMNTQAFRNFMFSSGYSADSAMELWFRNTKGTKEESAELKKGTIYDSLNHLFTFQTIRVSHVALELDKLLSHDKFMDCEAPKPDAYRKSTYYRWNDQVSVVYTSLHCTRCIYISNMLQIALMPNCKVQRRLGDHYFVVLEHVNVYGSFMTEPVTRVHIVCLVGFEWKDTETNVSIKYFQIVMIYDTRKTCRWCQPALVPQIETSRIAALVL